MSIASTENSVSMRSTLPSVDIYFKFYRNIKLILNLYNTQVLVLGLIVREYEFAASRQLL